MKAPVNSHKTDDNDLTYFLVAQLSIGSVTQLRQAEQDIQALALFNYRQVASSDTP